MASKTNRWKLGAFVLGSFATAIGVAIWLGLENLNREYEVYYSYFNESVDGLSLGSPVKFRGIPVGKVTGSS